MPDPITLLLSAAAIASTITAYTLGYDRGHDAASKEIAPHIKHLHERIGTLTEALIWREFPPSDDKGYFEHLVNHRQLPQAASEES